MRPAGRGIEDAPLELGLSGPPRIAIPDAARDEVEPPVRVHIQDRKADVGAVVGADEAPRPALLPPELEPVKPLGLDHLPTDHEVQIAVAIEVRKRGQAVVSRAVLVRGEVRADEVELELELAGEREAQNKAREGSEHGPGDMPCGRVFVFASVFPSVFPPVYHRLPGL